MWDQESLRAVLGCCARERRCQLRCGPEYREYRVPRAKNPARRPCLAVPEVGVRCYLPSAHGTSDLSLRRRLAKSAARVHSGGVAVPVQAGLMKIRGRGLVYQGGSWGVGSE